MNDNTKEFLKKLDSICREHNIELSSSDMSSDIDVEHGVHLVGYFPSVAKSSEFRDLS